jgi:hypothetical protein
VAAGGIYYILSGILLAVLVYASASLNFSFFLFPESKWKRNLNLGLRILGFVVVFYIVQKILNSIVSDIQRLK